MRAAPSVTQADLELAIQALGEFEPVAPLVRVSAWLQHEVDKRHDRQVRKTGQKARATGVLVCRGCERRQPFQEGEPIETIASWRFDGKTLQWTCATCWDENR